MIFVHETQVPTRSVHFDPLGFSFFSTHGLGFYERDANHSVVMAIHSDKVQETKILLVTSAQQHHNYMTELGHSHKDLPYFIPMNALRDLCGLWVVLFPELTPTGCFDALRFFAQHEASEHYRWADHLDRCLKDVP